MTSVGRGIRLNVCVCVHVCVCVCVYVCVHVCACVCVHTRARVGKIKTSRNVLSYCGSQLYSDLIVDITTCSYACIWQ